VSRGQGTDESLSGGDRRGDGGRVTGGGVAAAERGLRIGSRGGGPGLDPLPDRDRPLCAVDRRVSTNCCAQDKNCKCGAVLHVKPGNLGQPARMNFSTPGHSRSTVVLAVDVPGDPKWAVKRG